MATITGTNIPKFLDLIAYSEGTSTSRLTQDDGYDVIVSGATGPEIFTDFSQHPFAGRPAKLVRPGLESTAAGRYQLLYRYWLSYKMSLKLPDFGPLSQDRIAIQQIKERKALGAIESGDIESAITLCSGTWASFPGNAYGQNAHSMTTLMAEWNK